MGRPGRISAAHVVALAPLVMLVMPHTAAADQPAQIATAVTVQFALSDQDWSPMVTVPIGAGWWMIEHPPCPGDKKTTYSTTFRASIDGITGTALVSAETRAGVAQDSQLLQAPQVTVMPGESSMLMGDLAQQGCRRVWRATVRLVTDTH